MSKWPKIHWITTCILTLITAVGAVLIQQFYFKANNNYQIRTELLRKNYEYYRSAQNFSDLGAPATIKFLPGPPDAFFEIQFENGDVDTLRIRDMILAQFEVPVIAIDSAYQNQWFKEKSFIYQNKNKIDQKVYRKFLKVAHIVEQNPWPDQISKEHLIHSIWTKQHFIQEWQLANRELAAEVNKLIGF